MAKKMVSVELDFKENNSHKLDTVIKKFQKIDIIMAKINSNKINITGSNNSVVVNQVIDSFNKLEKKSKDVDKSFGKAFSIARISAIAYSFSKLTNSVAKFTKESANFIENLNLTEVAFYGNTNAVKGLYTSMADLYNLDESSIVRRIGIFKQMANTMGLANETGEQLASLMNKMTLDVSSLYNIDIERASNALQSALVGQTRPIRGATGADITEKTLERTTQRVLPERYIRDLSFVEKRLVMIISLTEQLKNSQGDWARTIESPSNQMRILGEQILRFTRAVGNFMLPVMSKILPYLNAFMMVITAITNSLARLVGYKLPKFDYSGLTGISAGAMDIEDNLNGAGASADKLKSKLSGLRGFDKLNVISTPTNAGGGGVGGAGSGIDSRLLEEFAKVSADYDDMLSSVQTRASKIADDVLRWMGFEKGINGEYKFRKLTLGTILGILGTITLLSLPLKAVFTVLGKIGNFAGFTGLSLGVKTFSKWIGTAVPLVWEFAKGGTSLSTLFGTLFPKTTKLVGAFAKFAGPIAGATALIAGSAGLYSATKNLTKGTDNVTKEVIKMTAGFTGAVAGGALLGSALGPVGTVVGALGGALVGGTASLIGYNKAIKELAEEKVFGTLTLSTEEWGQMLISTGPSIENYGAKNEELQRRLHGLKETFDSNSNAIDLYQVKFGMMGQKISEEDAPKIIDSITNMAESTTAIIEENTNYSLELWGSAFNEMSSLTEAEQQDILNHIIDYGSNQKAEIDNAQKNITSTYDNAIKARGYLTDEEYKYIQTQLKKIRDLTNKEMTKGQADVEFLKMQYADTNYKLDETSYKTFNKAISDYEKQQTEIIQSNYEAKKESARMFYGESDAEKTRFYNAMKEADAERARNEQAMDSYILQSKKDISANIAKQYEELTGKTDKESIKQRELIEGVWTNELKLPIEDLKGKYSTAGEETGKAYAKGIGVGFNKGNLKLTIPANSALGTTRQQMSMTASYTARKYGGFPDVGELFVANESGPEVVTTLGGKSVVANMEQMMTYLDRRIDTKLGNNKGGSKQPAVLNFVVGGKKIAEVVLDDLNDMATSNGKPIVIGG